VQQDDVSVQGKAIGDSLYVQRDDAQAKGIRYARESECTFGAGERARKGAQLGWLLYDDNPGLIGRGIRYGGTKRRWWIVAVRDRDDEAETIQSLMELVMKVLRVCENVPEVSMSR
jgi:hypothetical protein